MQLTHNDIPMPVDWLLAEGEPWVRYWTWRDLLGQAEDASDVQDARQAMVIHPLVQTLLDQVTEWPGPPLKRHNDASHPIHALATLAEFGLTHQDAALKPVTERVLAGQSADGPFTVRLQIHERYGGDGEPHPAWLACDAPTVLFALLAFGLGSRPGVKRALDHLLESVAVNGWRCGGAPQMGDFRGPGRQDDFCPYASLIALKAISRVPALRDSDAALAGIDALLWHWEHQTERKVYLFGIGTDFRKPKFPLIWYDILHVVDVLSRFPVAHHNPCFRSMLAALMLQMDDAGRFTAGSMYRAWKDWDFADKKHPSPTITAVAWRAWLRARVE